MDLCHIAEIGRVRNQSILIMIRRSDNSLACPETTEMHPANADQRMHAFNVILRPDDKLCDDTGGNRGDTWSAVHQQDGTQTQKRTVDETGDAGGSLCMQDKASKGCWGRSDSLSKGNEQRR